jgi:hypothetical protein
MDLQRLVNTVKETEQLKTENFAAKLDLLATAGVDEETINLLKKVARHDESVIEQIADLYKEAE